MAFRFNPTTSQLDWVNPQAGVSLVATKLQIQRIATVNIFAGDALKADSATHVSPATNDVTALDATVIGFAYADTAQGDVVDIVLFGVLSDTSFSVFDVNALLFLDIDGAITDVRPTSNVFLTEVGSSLGSGDIFITIKKPIHLA